jgi:4-carboxymuconolactone decarboxylase
MSRLPDLDPDKLTDAQRRVYEDITAGPRGGVRGPFPAWLHSPELADCGQKFGAFLRFNTSLEPRLSEIAILVIGRAWSAQYEWYAHARLAAKAGIDQAVIDAIAERRQPDFARDDEAVVYAYCKELQDTHFVGDEAYRAALDLLGLRGVVELTALSGYYTTVAMTLNVFQMPLPEGVDPPLAD